MIRVQHGRLNFHDSRNIQYWGPIEVGPHGIGESPTLLRKTRCMWCTASCSIDGLMTGGPIKKNQKKISDSSGDYKSRNSASPRVVEPSPQCLCSILAMVRLPKC